MLTSRIFLIAVIAICISMVTGAAIAQELIVNGDFEQVTAGEFDGWNYGDASIYSAYPISGNYSAIINNALLWQQASDTPLQDFTWELDFASLPVSSGARSLGVATYRKDAGETVDAICLYDVGGGSAELKFFNGSAWVPTGLYANITPDTGTIGVFDGEDPSVYMNHLAFTATEYGTADQGITITLNGNSYSLSDALQKESIQNSCIKTFGLFSQGYLVDNVSMTGTPLTPASVPLAGESLLANGDFEAITGEAVDSWTYRTSDGVGDGSSEETGSGAATLYPTPGGGNSLQINSDANNRISQQFSEEGVSDFCWELDFASMPITNGDRSFQIGTQAQDDAMGPQIDALRVTIGGELEYYSGAGFGWSGTGLIAGLTTDPMNPAINHLSFKGTGYGTNDRVFEITLNGESFIGTDSVLNKAPSYITLIGGGDDYVVDNVVVYLEGEGSSPIAGDANKDGKVDGSDVTILAGNWQAGVGDPNPETITWEMGDFNGDGQIDGSDVTILAGNWQAGVTAAAAAVPEPSTLALLAAGLFSGLFVMLKRNVSNKK